ncbi:MAG: redoxin domain-containing protein [Anaerolineae bacterium]|nr:redoxin domain-containing protein [Anaerolineae bacterium]
MEQIVDLQNDAGFQALGVPLVSIAFDSLDQLAGGAAEYGITAVPLLSDGDHAVSEAYGVLQWAVASGEPGHTFVLVDGDGQIAWLQDYGAPENRGVMYVEVDELTQEVGGALGR